MVYAYAIMKKLPVLVIASFLSVFPLAVSVHAQSPAAAQESENAYGMFSSGDYASAAKAYEEIIKGYPTDILVQSSTIQLAVCQLYTGQFDKALANLDKAKSGPALPADQAMLVDSLRPQILASKAASLKPTDSGRKAAFDQAIKAYDECITKYAQSPELESAYYGQAVCYYQINEFDKAIQDLKTSIQKFSTSPTIANSKNLLAITLMTQAAPLVMNAGGDKDKGMDLLKQAEDIFHKIIEEKKDLAIINDANFQLGEVLFMRAAFGPEADRPALYGQAADAYMAVLPKEDIEAMQKEKIKSFAAKKIDALRAKNLALKKQLDKDNERELKKLAEISAKQDQTAAALLKLGEVFFNSGKYNEARVVIRHVTPFISEDDEKMRASFYKAMSYALQNALTPAVASYKEFAATYKGKPIGENLPFLIGNLYLVEGKTEESIPFFEESLQLYPQGAQAGISVAMKAQAQMMLKQYDEALKTFQNCIDKNPTPEIGVIAQSGIANIYRDTARWKEALEAYKKTKDKYATTPQGIEASYWVAACMQQAGDNAGALPLFQEFIKAHGDHALIPLAVFALGNAQIATGQKDAGVATLAEVAGKYPESAPAPFTYFTRAQVFAGEQKPAEINKLMKEFIEKYPKDDKIYYAYSSLAQNAGAAGNIDQALATYLEFVEKYPEHANAPGTLVKIAELQRATAERLATNYTSLNAEDRVKWKTAMDASVASIEKLIAKYPQSSEMGVGLQSLLTAQKALVRSEIKKDAEVETYFQGLASNTEDPAAKSKILFTMAGFISEKDKPRALSKMTEAYNTSVVYTPKDMDIFGLALVDGKKFDEAQAVFEKLTNDYPIPAGTAPNAAPQAIQEAQATALFGKARVAQETKPVAESGKMFEQLKTLYPWSPKVLEANYGIARSLRASKPDEAMALLGAIIRAQNATAELRANSFLLYGYIMKDKTDAETDPKKKAENRGAAIDFFMKIPQFYAGVPAAAVPGLWEGGQLLEQQAEASTDPKFKAQQIGRAKAAYQQIVKDFPNDPIAPKAQARLQALGS
jgi:TolA-binding protein